MNLRYLLSVCFLFIIIASCDKDEPHCPRLPAGAGLSFRIVDTTGKDLVFGIAETPYVEQPCRDDSLITFFRNYRIPGRTDSGTVIAFNNLMTPEYGSGSTCFRIYFNWNNNDQDTVDWHYRLETDGDCTMQIIDYMSFNGIQAKKKTDYAAEYYELVKQ
jgi:hypothetical protein